MLETLGLSWQSLLFHCINLAIIVVAAYFLLRKPVRNMVEKQNKELSAIAEENEALTKEAEETAKNLVSITEQAKAEAAKIRQNAERAAAAKADAVVADAESLAKSILAEAKQEAANEEKRREEETEKRIASISVGIAKRILEREVTGADNQKIIDACIEELRL